MRLNAKYHVAAPESPRVVQTADNLLGEAFVPA
jgi:hypothetical protein